MHGVGVCQYTDGSRYQGDWKAGLKNGSGTHSFASGDQYEGEWENGWMHGLGVYTWKIGDKYIGEVRPRRQPDACDGRGLPAAAAFLSQGLPPRSLTRRHLFPSPSLCCSPCLTRRRRALSDRLTLAESMALGHTLGEPTPSTSAIGRRARCTERASRQTRTATCKCHAAAESAPAAVFACCARRECLAGCSVGLREMSRTLAKRVPRLPRARPRFSQPSGCVHTGSTGSGRTASPSSRTRRTSRPTSLPGSTTLWARWPARAAIGSTRASRSRMTIRAVNGCHG